jgi:hypothetical protein
VHHQLHGEEKLMKRGFSASRPRFRTVALATVSLATLASCAPSEDAETPDSFPPGTPLGVQQEPLGCVGVLSGDTLQEFFRVVTPFLLPDRRLVVPLHGLGEIRIFGLDGSFITRLGGSGEGPGEFKSLYAAWPRGDTVEAFDGSLRRITRFLPDGSTDVVPLERVRSAQAAIPGALSDGWALGGVADGPYGGRDRMALHLFARDGIHLGEIASLEGMERREVGNFAGPHPISPMAFFAVGNDRIYAGESLSPSVRVFDSAGALVGEMNWEPEEGVSPDAASQTVIAAAVSEADPDRAQNTRERLEAFPIADRVSVFWGLMADEAGFLWIRPFDPFKHSLSLGGTQGTGGDWLVLSPAGVPVTSVAVPDDLEPTFVGSDAIVGIRRDEHGVESVCAFELNRQMVSTVPR